MLQPLTACGETRVSAEVGQFSRWGRGARLTRRVREEYRVYFDRNATQNAAKRSGEQPVVEPTGAPRPARRPVDKAREGGIPGVFRPKRNDERREATRFSRDGSPAERRVGFTTGCLAGMDRRSNAAWVLPQAVNDSSRTRRDEPAPELPTALCSRRQQPRAHDWDRVSLSSLAPSCCPCNHPLCLRVRVNRNQPDLWMLHGKYAEYLICKGLADGFDFFEVEYNGLE